MLLINNQHFINQLINNAKTGACHCSGCQTLPALQTRTLPVPCLSYRPCLPFGDIWPAGSQGLRARFNPSLSFPPSLPPSGDRCPLALGRGA